MRQNRIDVAVATRPVNSTLDLRFADNVRRGIYPDTYTNYSELLAYLNYLHQQGQTKAQIEDSLGLRTAADFSYTKANGFSLNTRRMAELVPVGLQEHILHQEAAGRIPEGTLQKYLDDVFRTWNDSSKRSWELTQNGLGYWENGHWIAAKDVNSIGPTTGRNGNPELKNNFLDITGVEVKGNTGHSNGPRANMSVHDARTVGIPTNWFEDFYEFYLRDPELNGTGVNMGAGLARPLTDGEAIRLDSRTVTPDQLVAQDSALNEQKAQGYVEEPNVNLTRAGKVTQTRGPTFPNVSRSTKKIDLPDNYGQPTKVASPNSPVTKGLRLARNAAPAWASLPLGAVVTGQSIAQAVQNPNPDTIETALWDGANLIVDAASLHPLLAVPAEGAQRALSVGQAAREGQKELYRQKPSQSSAPKPIPKPTLSPQQRESFRAGGGNAAIQRDGLSVEQVIQRGSDLRLKEIHSRIIREQT